MRFTTRFGWILLACSIGLAVSCTAPPATRQDTSPTLAGIASGHSRWVDLGHPLEEGNPYWPGENYSPFKLETIATLEEDGVFSATLSMPEHLGTHLDAPNHFVEGQPSVDQLSLPQLVAPLVVIDVRQQVAGNSDYQVSVADIESWEAIHGSLPRHALVVAWTGWSDRWNDFESYKNQDDGGNLHFPGFSTAAAEFLVEKRVRGLGIDTLSVDPGISTDFAVHHIMHGSGAYHLENVAHLDQVPQSGAWVVVAPIQVTGGSGGPARVWAVF